MASCYVRSGTWVILWRRDIMSVLCVGWLFSSWRYRRHHINSLLVRIHFPPQWLRAQTRMLTMCFCTLARLLHVHFRSFGHIFHISGQPSLRWLSFLIFWRCVVCFCIPLLVGFFYGFVAHDQYYYNTTYIGKNVSLLEIKKSRWRLWWWSGLVG